MSKTLAVSIVLVMTAGTVFAQTGPRPERRVSTVDLLNARVPEITFQDAPFDQVMDWLASYTGMNVVVRWERLDAFGVERDRPITISVRNLRLSQVLWMIMNEAGRGEVKLAYRASGTLLVMSTAEDLGKEMLTRVYDVGDLLVRIPRFRNSPQIDLTQQTGGGGGNTQVFGGAGGGMGDEDDQQGTDELVTEEMQHLMDLIQQTIEPDTWAQYGGMGTIHAWRNQIVVRNNILVHQLLAGAIVEAD